MRQRPCADPDAMCLHISSGHRDVKANTWGAVLLIAAGHDPYKLLDAAVTQAAALSGALTACLWRKSVLYGIKLLVRAPIK